MSANLEKRRTASRWRALVSDPYRKLAAIGLASALYYYLDNQVNQRHTFTLALVTIDEAAPSVSSKYLPEALQVVVPTSKVTVQGFKDVGTDARVKQVELSVRGPKYAVEDVKRRTRPFQVGPFPTVDWNRAPSGFDVTVADLVADSLLQGMELTLQPPRIRIELEQNSEQLVPLSLDKVALEWQDSADGTRLNARLRTDTATFSKEALRLRGPTGQLASLGRDGRKLFRAVLRAKADDLQVEGTVELNPDTRAAAEHVTIDQGVTMTMQVRPDPKTYTLDIPLLIDDRSLPPRLRGRYWPDSGVDLDRGDPPARPDQTYLFLSKSVEVNVSGSLLLLLRQFDDQDPELAAWARRHLRLRLWIPPQDGVQDPPSLIVQATLELVHPQASTYDPICYSLKGSVALSLVLHP